MSNLSMRLKQRARVLAVGVVLSAATLAILPGAAEATGTCGCPGNGDTDGSGGNTNTSTGNVGQVTGQDLVDLGDANLANNTNAGLNTPVLSPDSDQSTSGNDQNVDSGGSGGGSGSGQEESNTNTSTGNIGQATLQDGLDVGDINAANNNNVGLNTPVLSADSDQSTSGNDQSVNSGGSGGNDAGEDSNTNTSKDNVGQLTLQDGVDAGDVNLGNNNNAGLNTPVLSPDSDQSTSGNNQNVNSGSAGGDNNAGEDSNTNTSTGNIGQATGQDLVEIGDINAANNNNAGANAPIFSPDSDQSTSDNNQNVDSSGGSGGNDVGEDSNTNTSKDNVGQATLQDGVDVGDINLGNNNNAGLNTPILSPDSDQSTSGNNQDIDSGGSSGGDNGSQDSTNTSTGNIGQVTGQDLVDIGDVNAANNTNLGANAPILSPDSDQSTSGNDQSVNSGGSGGNDAGEDSNTNTSKDNVGQATLQDGVDVGDINLGNNNNAGVNAPILSPDSDQKTDNNDQNVDSGGSGGTPGGGSGGTPGGGGGCSCDGDSPDNGDSKPKFNSGNGNGSEGGDPGNSGLTGANNAGGDEVGQQGGTRNNPGGQDSPTKDNKRA